MKAQGTQAEFRSWQCLCCISDNRNSSALGLSSGYARRAPRTQGPCTERSAGVKLGEPQYPRHSRQLPSAEQGKSPPPCLVHSLVLGCEGRRCSSGLGWVPALGNKA